MRFFADLHVHSKFSRAVSQDMDIPHIDHWAKIKGIGLMGTGDFTHPQWFASLKQELVEDGSGFLQRKDSPEHTKFVLSAEISCIYSKLGKTRRIHLIVLAPDFATVEKINNYLNLIGNLKSDGRPILGLDAEELTKIVMDANPKNMVIPAHAWTPWFSLFGSMSGFDRLQECFGSMTPHIYALETGLSSDPAMNWRLSQLDRISITSYSDAHSPKPNKMGREATELELQAPTYDNLIEALKSQSMIIDGQRPKNIIASTVEFFPEEGKYHWDGHREHNIRWSPEESKRHKGVCSVCGRPVTIGVENRVEQLADRPVDFKPTNRPPFRKMVPLEEIISEAVGTKPGTKKVGAVYERLTAQANEFDILLKLSGSELQSLGDPRVAEGIERVRSGKLDIVPGYDGVFGTVHIFSSREPAAPVKPQATLF